MYSKSLALLVVSALFLLNGCTETTTTSYNKKQNSTTSTTQTNAQGATQTSTTTQKNLANLKQIDVLVVVDANDANTQNGTTQTKIDHFMAVTNQIFQNSTVPAKVNVVKVQPYAFSKQNSKSALSEIYHNQSIAAIRNSVHADLVVIYRSHVNDGVCGIAYLNKTLDSSIGYAHVNLTCPSTTTAHEIGHTMGLNHSTKKTSKNGHLAYGHGYGVEGEFSTIMSYTSTYRTSIRAFNYSSPNLECQGYECGVANIADSVKALQNSIAQVSNFR